MKDYLAYFSRQPRVKLLTIGHMLVLVIFCLDYLTGVEFTFSIFYLIAVFFVAWFVGKTAGAVISLVSAAAWLLADILVSPSHLHPLFSTWNTLGMFGFFLLLTYLLVAFKSAMQQEKRMARKIQVGLLPESLPQIRGYEIATAWQPADTVAGDYFDVLPLGEHVVGFCIADVAGHNQPVLLHCDGKIEHLDRGGGIPLGVEAQRQYQQTDTQLQPGDRLVLFTDGLIECTNFKDEEFGQKRLLDLLCEYRLLNAIDLQKHVINAAAEFCQNTYSDDLTLMIIAVT